MNIDHYIAQGDTSPLLTFQCLDDKGKLITKTLVGAVLQFHMMTNDGSTVLIPAGVGSTVGADFDATKVVGYAWQAGNTSVSSLPDYPHLGEMQITFADTTIETFPNDGYIQVHVRKQIA